MAIEVSPELLSFLQGEESRGRNEELLERAESALKSYNGDYYGDEVEGNSQVVSRDVAEVVDHMNVAVLAPFVSGDRVVEFEADNEEQEQFADDATESISREFSRKGFALLHDWLKEGHISTLGIVKATAVQRKKREEFYTLDPEGEGALEADLDLEQSEQAGVEVFRAIRLADAPVEFKDYLVPLEEFRISPDARDPDDAAYIAHSCVKTISELVEMGFDREDVEDVEDVQGDYTTDTLSHARDNGMESQWNTADRHGALRKVVLMEEYVRFDADGDGIAERLCIHRVGNTVLRVEPVDYQPFVIYCPFPMPGRMAGHSLADKVTDIQRINTRLQRLMLDGLALSLAPRHWINEASVTENTYDDYLTVIPGGIVRGKGEAPVPLGLSDMSGNAMQAIEFMIGQRESRTGITRHNQGLDANSLNKTATGAALAKVAGQQIQVYLARNFGEAVARLMRLKLKLKSRYAQPSKLKVDGEYRDIDPSQWPEDMAVVIRVGLGTGDKSERLNARMNLLQIQRECMMAGLPIVGPEQVFKSIRGVVKDSDLGSPDDFVIDPSTIQPPVDENGQPIPEPPSPEEQKLQAEMQMQAAKLQGEQQIQAAKIEAQREQAQVAAELARAKAEEEATLAREKAQAELQLAEAKFAAEMNMAERKMQFEAQRAARDADRRDYESSAKVSANRSGGDLDK